MSVPRTLDRFCYTICIITIVAGVAVGIAMIWLPGMDDVLWKALATLAIVFGGAALTLSVNRTIAGRLGDDDRAG